MARGAEGNMPGKCLKCKTKSPILYKDCIRPQYVVPVKGKMCVLKDTEKQGFFFFYLTKMEKRGPWSPSFLYAFHLKTRPLFLTGNKGILNDI